MSKWFPYIGLIEIIKGNISLLLVDKEDHKYSPTFYSDMRSDYIYNAPFLF